MQYMILIYQNETARQGQSEQQLGEVMGAYMAYTKALHDSGVWVAGDRLASSSTATTVRMEGGSAKVLNGPYAETREQLGGFYIIEAPDLDAALAWAARCPGVDYGVLEVRPVMGVPKVA